MQQIISMLVQIVCDVDKKKMQMLLVLMYNDSNSCSIIKLRVQNINEDQNASEN